MVKFYENFCVSSLFCDFTDLIYSNNTGKLYAYDFIVSLCYAVGIHQRTVDLYQKFAFLLLCTHVHNTAWSSQGLNDPPNLQLWLGQILVIA